MKTDQRIYDRAPAAVMAALMREAARGCRKGDTILYIGKRGTLDVGRDVALKATARTIEALRVLGPWTGPHPRANGGKKGRRS